VVDLTAALRQRCDPHTGEVLFTLEQVKDIVRRAVEEKERNLRELFERILQEKLQGVLSSQRRELELTELTRFALVAVNVLTIASRAIAEQYKAFAKFNEDYISRQLKSGDLSYCS